MVLNNCTKGVKEMYTARKQQCPNRPPKGLLLTTKDGKLTANLGSNVTFLVHLDEVNQHGSFSGLHVPTVDSCYHPPHIVMVYGLFFCANWFFGYQGEEEANVRPGLYFIWWYF